MELLNFLFETDQLLSNTQGCGHFDKNQVYLNKQFETYDGFEFDLKFIYYLILYFQCFKWGFQVLYFIIIPNYYNKLMMMVQRNYF